MRDGLSFYPKGLKIFLISVFSATTGHHANDIWKSNHNRLRE